MFLPLGLMGFGGLLCFGLVSFVVFFGLFCFSCSILVFFMIVSCTVASWCKRALSLTLNRTGKSTFMKINPFFPRDEPSSIEINSLSTWLSHPLNS